MNTFLKILLGIVLVVVAIKLLPFALVVVLGIAAALVVAGLIGFSALAGIFCAIIAATAVLAPIWVPVLAIVGIIALIKKAGARSA